MSIVNETNPLVSIITPSYNSEAYIKDAIESVLAQTYTNWEMIIVDDCSTDNTVKIVNSYNDKRIQLVKLDVNSGPAIARNTAIAKAAGRYLAFLDSDDQWLPKKLEKQLHFMQINNIGFSFSNYEKITESGNKTGNIVVAPTTIDYNRLLKDNVIGCLTVMLDRDIIGNVSMLNIRTRQDWVLWLVVTKRGFLAYGIQEVLAKYRERNDSISGNKFKMMLQNWKVYREIEKINRLKSLWLFINNIYYKLKKYKY
ncbi:MAG: glycosyltransferase [Bacillaceae bacterium]|nr:glycosyltransferase [Bacillaceae bacterium]